MTVTGCLKIDAVCLIGAMRDASDRTVLMEEIYLVVRSRRIKRRMQKQIMSNETQKGIKFLLLNLTNFAKTQTKNYIQESRPLSATSKSYQKQCSIPIVELRLRLRLRWRLNGANSSDTS